MRDEVLRSGRWEKQGRRNGRLRSMTGKRRFGYLVMGVTIETSGIELVFVCFVCMHRYIAVIGKQVMQVLPGGDAERKQQQHGQGHQGFYDGFCLQILLIQGCKLGKIRHIAHPLQFLISF